jgi:hypothetical protein
MKSKPTDAAAGLDIDYDKITHDMRAFALCEPTLPMGARLHEFIIFKQQFLTSSLTPDPRPPFLLQIRFCP